MILHVWYNGSGDYAFTQLKWHDGSGDYAFTQLKWYEGSSESTFTQLKWYEGSGGRAKSSYLYYLGAFLWYMILRGWCSMISLLSMLRSMCVYISVVPMFSWPSIHCMILRFAPPSRRCVANECRKVCGLMDFLISARSANSLIRWKTIILLMPFPHLARKT